MLPFFNCPFGIWCDIWIILFSISSTVFFVEIYSIQMLFPRTRKRKKTFKTIRKSFNENNFLLGKPDDDAFVVVVVCRLIDLRIEDLLMKSHDECSFLMRSRK